MGKSTISMAIFNSYFKLLEGICSYVQPFITPYFVHQFSKLRSQITELSEDEMGMAGIPDDPRKISPMVKDETGPRSMVKKQLMKHLFDVTHATSI